MYLSELIGGLRRRWWLVIIGLLGTAILTYTAFGLVRPVQEARASVLVLPPAKAAGDAGNPYLVLGGLQPAADILAAAMNSGSLHESLAPVKGTAKFEVTRDTSSSGPLLVVDVTDTDPIAALTLLHTVVETMPTVLAQLQAQVDVRSPSNRMTLTEITRDTEPEPSIKTQLRATLVAAVGGLALTLFGVNAIDGLLLRRNPRRPATRALRLQEDEIIASWEPSASEASPSPSARGSASSPTTSAGTTAEGSQADRGPQQVGRRQFADTETEGMRLTVSASRSAS